MGSVGFNAWFGGVSSEADAWERVDQCLAGLGFSKGQADPLSGSVGYANPAFPTGVPLSIGVSGPVANFSIYPITNKLRRSSGDDKLRSLLRDLCDGTSVLLGRTDTAEMMGVVTEAELQSGPDWFDWFQYWGPDLVRRWGLDRIKAGPFRLVEPRPSGACALTLFDGPDDPDQMKLQRRAAKHLGIQLREFPGSAF